ncbi:MAG: inorganic diphosphatase [Alphaproteobacteria bacterium]|jgi:inorganic pyrophosphatase|uniref:inorganic diphosphatase n=1 Tax=Pacificispira sp. TaxID=2888761 RepID=UPI001B2EA950|nr:inorganic diphosphatase [Alphaproteobacteria bacterium]MBO6863911.1 inorganic diphosphatase [Alphaproteobacteria bacterium]MEC9264680.1 inorganic diphosphatase [Pseudomonadota bacterium]
MRVDSIPVGENPPWDVNVIIEVPIGADPVKYELDKESGALYVDRFLHTAMFYPANYGFIPHTLCGDGDPIDVLVVGRVPVVPGAIVRSRPVGVMIMEDEGGMDEKIIAVPHDKLHSYYEDVSSYRDLPKILIDQIAHFFTHYKDLEKGKWAKIARWGEAGEAAKLIEDSMAAHNLRKAAE